MLILYFNLFENFLIYLKTFSFILEWKIPSICVSNCPTAAVTLCFPIFLVYISQIMCFLSPHTKSQDLIPRVFVSHKKPYTLFFVIALHLHYFFSVIKQHCFIFLLRFSSQYGEKYLQLCSFSLFFPLFK